MLNWRCVDTELKATKPQSAKSLRKHLKRALKGHNFSARGDYKELMGRSACETEVIDWCAKWLIANGFKANFQSFDHLWYLVISPPHQKKLTFKVGSALRLQKPHSTKTLRKILAEGLKDFDFRTQGSYKCRITAVCPPGVIAWCVSWLKHNGLVAWFAKDESEGGDIFVSGHAG